MFFDSSVLSTRTISCRPSASPARVPAAARTSSAAARSRSAAASTPSGCTATSVIRPRWETRPPPPRAAYHPRAEHRLAAVEERRGPALGEEPGVVGAEHAVEDGRGHVVRQHPVVLGRRPRRVLEVRDPRLRVPVAQHPRRQGQVVVLNEHPRARHRLLRQRGRERLVVGAVGVPVAAELRVEHRLVGRVEEQVVHEPEDRVGDAVVRGVEHGAAGSRASGPPARRAHRPARRAGRPPGRRRTARCRARARPRRRPPPASPDVSPEIMPPPPRLAVSDPSSPRLYETGPRFEATSRSRLGSFVIWNKGRGIAR